MLSRYQWPNHPARIFILASYHWCFKPIGDRTVPLLVRFTQGMDGKGGTGMNIVTVMKWIEMDHETSFPT